MATELKKKSLNSQDVWLQVSNKNSSVAIPNGYTKSLVTFSNYFINSTEKVLSQLTDARLVKTFTAFHGTPLLSIVLKRNCLVTLISYVNKYKVTFLFTLLRALFAIVIKRKHIAW
jgi:hypothetical protein